MTAPEKKKTPKSFEDKMNALDEIVQELEKGDLNLKDALDRYERGHALARELQNDLNQAEKRMQEIMNGQLVEAQDDV